MIIMLSAAPALLERFKMTIEKLKEWTSELLPFARCGPLSGSIAAEPVVSLPKIGVAPGAMPHQKIKDDFVAQFDELNEKLHKQSVELEHKSSEHDWPRAKLPPRRARLEQQCGEARHA
jgi:hypothetical protein